MIDANALFAQHLDLAPLGARRRSVVCCRFYEDRTPSLSVDLDAGILHCFGCGAPRWRQAPAANHLPRAFRSWLGAKGLLANSRLPERIALVWERAHPKARRLACARLKHYRPADLLSCPHGYHAECGRSPGHAWARYR